MVGVAQLVRASGCGSEGRGFEPHHPPHISTLLQSIIQAKLYASIAQLDRAPDFGSGG